MELKRVNSWNRQPAVFMPSVEGQQSRNSVPFSRMVLPAKAGEAPAKPVPVWINQTQNSVSLFVLDSPLCWRNTTIPVVDMRRQVSNIPQQSERVAMAGGI